MTFNDSLIQVALQEWKRWGYSTNPLHARKVIGGTESQPPYVDFVNAYWQVVGQPDRNGKSDYAWSAAFISFCFQGAGAGAQFPYAAGHWDYCAAIVGSPAKFPSLTLGAPDRSPLAVGDLIWAARRGKGCPQPPLDAAQARTALARKRWFCSHADIVVAMRQGEVDVIGGNVSDSVTRTTYVTTNGVISDPRHTWIGVLKNTI